jgi:hypothetical protein
MREVELGLVADGFFEPYPAVVRVLEEPGAMNLVEVGGSSRVDFQLLMNWDGFRKTWRYPDQRDVRLVMRVTTDGETLGVDQFLRRLSAVGEWRVLTDR